MKKFTLITKKGCPFCDQIKRVLKEEGIKFLEMPAKSEKVTAVPTLIRQDLETDTYTVLEGLPNKRDLLVFIKE